MGVPFIAVHLLDRLPRSVKLSQGQLGRGTEGGDFRVLVEVRDPIACVIREEIDGKSIEALRHRYSS